MSLIHFNETRCELLSATALPFAAGYLWNRHMMIHATARGFATAQFMQPEPAKYARGPILEAKQFMLPEQGTYAHHPGRFFYLKDRETKGLWSLPHEPVRRPLEDFRFTVLPDRLTWSGVADGIAATATLTLTADDVCELWTLDIVNTSERPRQISVYPFFPLGFMSWMNQEAFYDTDLGAIVASSVTPYQKIPDYFKNKDLKDKTYLLSLMAPDAWETRQAMFEGEGGLPCPDGIRAERLGGGQALYENPAAILQFNLDLAPGERIRNLLIFGPAKDEAEIADVKSRYLSWEAHAQAQRDYTAYVTRGRGVLNIDCPDPHLRSFVNTWLPRQVYYHGDTNRLSTDPQTRNFLQDAMGSVYIQPQTARAVLLKALSQQHANGSMPDGITLYDGAELKYINQVPHTDHGVWLAIFLEAYLDETDDYPVLDERVFSAEGELTLNVRDRISAAIQWLINSVDHRGLNYIDQGDWNDPMNMVGWKGKGVSGWLSLATAHAARLWAMILKRDGRDGTAFAEAAERFNAASNTHLWDGDWYARGITDDDVVFGVKADDEGRIYLNPQSFAFLSGAADDSKTRRMLNAVEAQLETPFGVEMIAPAYTYMREDVGRLTQKFPGVAENGSVYNHAAMFYIYSLYSIGQADKAFELLRKMLTGPDEDDLLRRGQLPVFVPNYYRGAWRQFPDAAGRSSHLFNTGTASWLYRTVIEGLFGLKGTREGLMIAPQLPAQWQTAKATRQFRGGTIEVSYRRGPKPGLTCAEAMVDGNILKGLLPGKTYSVEAII